MVCIDFLAWSHSINKLYLNIICSCFYLKNCFHHSPSLYKTIWVCYFINTTPRDSIWHCGASSKKSDGSILHASTSLLLILMIVMLDENLTPLFPSSEATLFSGEETNRSTDMGEVRHTLKCFQVWGLSLFYSLFMRVYLNDQ